MLPQGKTKTTWDTQLTTYSYTGDKSMSFVMFAKHIGWQKSELSGLWKWNILSSLWWCHCFCFGCFDCGIGQHYGDVAELVQCTVILLVVLFVSGMWLTFCLWYCFWVGGVILQHCCFTIMNYPVFQNNLYIIELSNKIHVTLMVTHPHFKSFALQISGMR